MAVSIAEFEKALNSLDEAFQLHDSFHDDAVKKLARDACIQRFEFCVELAWKTSARMMGSSSTAANVVIREMARNDLIEDPNLWFGFILARNQSSHSYDEDVAQSVFASADQFRPHGRILLSKLKTR